MENYAAVWRRVCLCSLISARSENKILHLPLYPSTGGKNQTGALVFSTSLPSWAEQTLHVQLPLPRFAQEGGSECPGCPGAPLWGSLSAHSKSHQHEAPPHLVQVWMRDVQNHHQSFLPGASSSPGLSSACPGLELLSHLSLEHSALCQPCWPCQQPAQFCRLIFLGTFVLKMTRFLSFGRSLLAKVEISKPSQIHIAKLYPPYMTDCSIPVQFSTAHLPQSFQQQPGRSDGQSSLEAFHVIYSAHELSSHDCSKG